MEHSTNLFDRSGGVRAMAKIVDEAPSTVQSWKETGRIPSIKQPRVLDLLTLAGLKVTAEDMIWPLGRNDPLPAECHGADACASDGEAMGETGVHIATDSAPLPPPSTGQSGAMSRNNSHEGIAA